MPNRTRPGSNVVIEMATYRTDVGNIVTQDKNYVRDIDRLKAMHFNRIN
jgi:hypothetical protein